MPEKKEKINEEMIEMEAEKACLETEGVSNMVMLPSDILAENLRMKNPSRGIRLSKSGDKYEIDVFVEVFFGSRIPEIAWNMQENVKSRVEANTDARINKVNIHIEGVKPCGEN